MLAWMRCSQLNILTKSDPISFVKQKKFKAISSEKYNDHLFIHTHIYIVILGVNE